MKIGMYYWPQGFGATGWNAGDDCQNWTFTDPHTGETLHAFRCPQKVLSCCWRPGPDLCYSTDYIETIERHVQIFDNMGVEFLIYDNTNATKFMSPHVNIPWVAAEKIQRNVRQASDGRIKSVYMLSLTHRDDGVEHFVGDPYFSNRLKYVKEYIERTAENFRNHQADFLHLSGKPLLLFYISQGSNVKMQNGSLAFHGPQNTTPTISDFDLEIKCGNERLPIRELFTLRYAVQCSTWDFQYGSEVWPWTCDYGLGNFVEAGYASLTREAGDENDESKTPPNTRSNDLFNFFVDKAHSRGCPFLVIKGWNEFSISGDEGDGTPQADGYYKAHTIEPCTVQAPNGDPFVFLRGIETKLRSIKA